MTDVLIDKGRDKSETDTPGDKAMGRQRQKLGWRRHKPRIVGSPQKLGERHRFSLRVSKRNQPSWHLDSRLLASLNCERINFHCLKQDGFWSFVIAALRNWCQLQETIPPPTWMSSEADFSQSLRIKTHLSRQTPPWLQWCQILSKKPRHTVSQSVT